MKNYPHLYTPVNKKASFSNQIKTTHKKATSIFATQNQYSKNPSSKTINPLNKPSIRRGNQTPRISSRSIEEMYLDRSSQDNYDMMQRKKILLEEHRKMNQFYPPPTFKDFSHGHQNMVTNYQADRYSVQSNEENELFHQSYQKIGQIRFHVNNKSIDHELNEVLQLIKQEKMRANQTVRTLKKAADHYKKLCDSVNKSFKDQSINTQQQLPYFKQVCTNDAEIQYESEQKIKTRNSSPTFAKVPDPLQERPQTPETIPETVDSPTKIQSPTKEQTQAKQQQIIGKQKQIYTKLATMLEDMNINSKQILPEQIQLNFEVKDYKNLSQTEIIKIQKFFIKKLVEKIPK